MPSRSFLSATRHADVYEWGNKVLIPGLFGGNSPCGESVGRAGFFQSGAGSKGPTDVRAAMQSKGCNDDGWDDDARTPLSVEDYLKRVDQIDWTAGLMIRQADLYVVGFDRMRVADEMIQDGSGQAGTG